MLRPVGTPRNACKRLKRLQQFRHSDHISDSFIGTLIFHFQVDAKFTLTAKTNANARSKCEHPLNDYVAMLSESIPVVSKELSSIIEECVSCRSKKF